MYIIRFVHGVLTFIPHFINDGGNTHLSGRKLDAFIVHKTLRDDSGHVSIVCIMSRVW